MTRPPETTGAAAALLDTRLGIETPEGVRLELRPAGPVPRFAAFAIDFMIRIAVYMILVQLLTLAGGMGIGLLLIGVFLLEWFYPVVFELSLAGATPGKRALGIAVVMDNGLPVNAGASITRNLLRFVDFLPMAYGFGLLSMLLSPDFKRLGDFAAGTRVVYRDKLATRRKLPDAVPVASARPLAPEAQLAMIGLAERSVWLTRERLDELVELAANVESGHAVSASATSVQALRERVFGVAQWLMGKR